MRRPPFSLVVLWAGVLSLAPAPGHAAPDTPGPIELRIERDGSPIGTHRIAFAREGESLVVETTTRVRVRALSITIYRYEQDKHEVWRDGRLVSFESRTDRDGEETRLRARAEGEWLVVHGPNGRRVLAPDLVPTGFWDSRLIGRRRLLDSTDGDVLEVSVIEESPDTIVVNGDAVAARRYRIEGDIERAVWYDAAGRLIKLRERAEDGSTIEHVPAAGAHAGPLNGQAAEPRPRGAPDEAR